MSAKDHLSRYADGWMKGDPEIILGSVSSDYGTRRDGSGRRRFSDRQPSRGSQL